jgi:hypothetical protein
MADVRDQDTTGQRRLSVIASEIRSDWDTMSPHAKPYVDAMACLNDMNDSFGVEGADSIVRYFLVNAQTWKGAVARSVKAELRGMLKR